MLVGISGSGKTTYAKKLIEEISGTHLSSDSIRKELYGDESIQDDPSVVFDIMRKRALYGLDFGYNVIYDATNVTRKDRASILSVLPKYATIECHIVWAPIETCIERDAVRKRTVGKEVIDKMLKRFQAPFFEEGFDEIKVIYPDDFNSYHYSCSVIDAMRIPHDNPHHTLGILEHCIEAEKYLKKNNDEELRIAARFHDVGKPYVKSFTNSKGEPCEYAHFYSHQCVSAWVAYGLKCSVYTVWLISTHMDPFLDTKYYRNLPPFLKEKIDLLHEADLNAH